MPPKIIEKVKGFVVDPVEAFGNARSDNPGDVLKYFVVILAVNVVLTGLLFIGKRLLHAVISGGGAVALIVEGGIFVLGEFVGGTVLFFLACMYLHLFVALVVGGKGIEQTFRALAYGATPGMLLGWIPLIGFIAWIWTAALVIIGFRELHETSTLRAAVAVLLPLFLLVVLFFVMLFALVMVRGGV
jgi:hypothetical protein